MIPVRGRTEEFAAELLICGAVTAENRLVAQ